MSDNTFTPEEIAELQNSAFRGIYNRDNQLWHRAFNFYNARNKERELWMGCAPCYAKVVQFITKYNQN